MNQRLITIGLVLLVWYVFYQAMANTSPILLSLLALAPIAIYLVSRPHVWLLAVFVALYSGFTIPGLPQGFMLYHLFAVSFTVFTFARIVIRPEEGLRPLEATTGFAFLYVLVVFITMCCRGFGLRFTGDEMWGGGAYLRLYFAFAFLVAAGALTVEEATWRRFLWLAFGASALPALAHIIFLASDASIVWPYYFLRQETWALTGSLSASLSGRGVVRYFFLTGVAQALYILVLAVLPRRFLLPGVCTVVVLHLLSGFRSSLTMMLMVTAGYLFFYRDKARKRRLIGALALGLVLLGALTPFVQKLPLSAQRSLSIVPFYKVAYAATQDADLSTQWRLEIWRLMRDNLPKYFWLGSGITINQRAAYSSNPYYAASPESAYAFHNYHNGPLGVLHDFGIGGMLTLFGFLIASNLAFVRRRRLFQPGTFLHRYYTVLLATYCAQTISFLFVFGDVFDSVPSLFYSAVLLRCVIRTQQTQAVAVSPVPAATAPPPDRALV